MVEMQSNEYNSEELFPYKKKLHENEKILEEWKRYYDPKAQRMTHRYDEATKTWIKNETFSEIWNMKGGVQQDNDLQVGEPVYLRGKSTNTVWHIKHIGPKFITVETTDPLNDEDNIQVVTAQEIMRPNDIQMSNGNNDIFDKPMFQGGNMSRDNYPQNEQGSGKIVFAPNIVVNTGNDNNMTIPSSIGTENMPFDNGLIGDNPYVPTADNGMIRNISMPTVEPAKSSKHVETMPEEKPADSGATTGGGLLDFAKGFFIKKVQ